MRRVVFLRAVNVGGANVCRPAKLAKQLSTFGLVNIGAAGTFVVRERVGERGLRTALAKKLPFKSEIMICSAKAIIDLVTKDPFRRQPSGPDITRFISVLARRPQKPLRLPLNLPSNKNWALKIIDIENQLLIGLYRRNMKAISYLGKIEKILGVPMTTRSWNTIQKIADVIGQNSVT